MTDFLHKNSWFLGSGIAEWNVLVFGYVILLTLFYCNFFLPVLKTQKGGYIQDGVENVYILHPICAKIIFLSIFLLILFTLGKNKTFMEEFFLENSKWRNNLIWKTIFFKKFQNFIIEQPLNEMFSFFDMLQF
jgi:hypothetical protein